MENRRYVLNTLFNQGAFVINILLALVLSPIVVGRLGDEMYGLWTLIVAVTGYYNFIDLGIRSAVGQYVTRHMAAGDRERLDKTLGTSLLVLLLVAGLVVILTITVAAVFPHFFKIDADRWSDVRIAVLLSGAAMALKFPTGVFQSIVIACHRWDVLSTRTVIARVAHGAAVLGFLLGGWGILGVAIATVSAQVLEACLLWSAARKHAPEARLSLTFDREAFREIRSYGVFAFVISICEQIIMYMDAFVIGYFLGPVAVTFYTIGANLIPYMDGLILSLSGQIRPLAIAADAGNRGEEMKALLVRGSRYVTAFLCLLFAGILTCGPDFLGAWMGEKYLAGEPWPSSGSVLIILTLAHLFFNSSTVCRQILFGQRKNNVLAVIISVEAVANLVLKLILVHPFGILGVAIGTLIPMALLQGIVTPWVAARQIGASLRAYWLHSTLPNIALAIATTIAGLAFREWVPLGGWARVIAVGAFVGTLHTAGVFLLIVDPHIRAKALAKLGALRGRAGRG